MPRHTLCSVSEETPVIEISLRDMADEYDQPVPASHGGFRTKWPEEREGIIDTAVMREAANLIARLRALVSVMIENDPNDYAADAVTVLDVWRKDARDLISATEEKD